MNKPEQQHAFSHGQFNFMTPQTQPSLLRNGRVKIQRDPEGNTASSEGIDLEPHRLAVCDARQLPDAERPGLDANGFELQHQPLASQIDFFDHQDVVSHYYPDCAAIVAQVTGATAYAFDHNVRSAGGQASGQSIKGGQDVQGPAHLVHGDYTLRSAPDRLQQLSQPPSGNDTLRGYLDEDKSLIPPAEAARVSRDQGRYAIINVWRSIAEQPVATHPLALCDGKTVSPDELVVFEIHYPDRVGENYFARYSANQRMYYYPAMTSDEVLLIKQWDSAGPLARSSGMQGDGEDASAPCTFSFHSAFVEDDTPADAPDRWSIEVRCMVIYPD